MPASIKMSITLGLHQIWIEGSELKDVITSASVLGEISSRTGGGKCKTCGAPLAFNHRLARSQKTNQTYNYYSMICSKGCDVEFQLGQTNPDLRLFPKKWEQRNRAQRDDHDQGEPGDCPDPDDAP